MDAIVITKRSYHPLVLFFYYSNLLTSDQLAQIPETTIAYWNKSKLELMFGSDWVKGVSADYENFSKIQKRKIVAKAAKLCLKTLACLISMIKTIFFYLIFLPPHFVRWIIPSKK